MQRSSSAVIDATVHARPHTCTTVTVADKHASRIVSSAPPGWLALSPKTGGSAAPLVRWTSAMGGAPASGGGVVHRSSKVAVLMGWHAVRSPTAISLPNVPSILSVHEVSLPVPSLIVAAVRMGVPHSNEDCMATHAAVTSRVRSVLAAVSVCIHLSPSLLTSWPTGVKQLVDSAWQWTPVSCTSTSPCRSLSVSPSKWKSVLPATVVPTSMACAPNEGRKGTRQRQIGTPLAPRSMTTFHTALHA